MINLNKLLPLLILTILSCNLLAPSDPKPNIVIPSDISSCKAGCDYLDTLPGQDGKKGCLESRPLIEKDGGIISCEEFCTITEKNGRALNPKCWTTLKSCDEIEACRKDN